VQIKVTNEWTNWIAGDRGAPPERRVLRALFREAVEEAGWWAVQVPASDYWDR
jgi:hypothetical protein